MAKKEIPQSRLMINYETKVDGVRKKKDLPYKVLIVADLSNGASIDAKKDLADREVRNTTNGVDRTLSDMNISLDLEVPNFVSKDAGNISVCYKLNGMKDFKPNAVAEKVPEIKALMELKEILTSFSKDIDNNRNLKKVIDAVFSDEKELMLLKSKIPELANYSITSTEEKNSTED
jgi:type VI secretion system protein ImpB